MSGLKTISCYFVISVTCYRCLEEKKWTEKEEDTCGEKVAICLSADSYCGRKQEKGRISSKTKKQERNGDIHHNRNF